MTGMAVVLVVLGFYGLVLAAIKPPMVAHEYKQLLWSLGVVAWVVALLGGMVVIAWQRGWL